MRQAHLVDTVECCFTGNVVCVRISSSNSLLSSESILEARVYWRSEAVLVTPDHQ